MRARFFLCAVLAAAVPGLEAEDSALVPLETESLEVEEALFHFQEGRYREGIEILQGTLSGERRPGDKRGLLLQVPPDLPRDPRRLRDALRAVSSSAAREDAVPQAPEGPGARQFAPPLPGGLRVGRPEPVLRRPVVFRPAPVFAPGRRYLPVTAVAEAALLALPPEGIAVYRGLYDGLSGGLLARYRQDREPAALVRVATELFLTRSGDDAAEMLGDELSEAGSYRAAIAWWRKVLDEYPGSDLPPERVREKVLHTLRGLGDEKGYKLERERFVGAPGGKDVLAALERSVPLVSPEDRPAGERSSRWGGELSVSLLPALPAGPLGLSWDTWVWSRETVEPSAGRAGVRRRSFGAFEDRKPLSPSFPFCPLLDGDSAYVSGVFSLYRFDSRPGGGSLTREYRKPIPAAEVFQYEEREAYDSALYTTTIWKKAADPAAREQDLPDEVLVTQYLSDRVKPRDFMRYAITVEIPIRSLVAYDAASGKMLWKTGKGGTLVADDDVLRQDIPGRRDEGRGMGREGIQPRMRGWPAEEDHDADEDADDWIPADDDEPQRPERIPGGLRGPSAEDEDETGREREFSYTSPAVVKAGRVVAGGWVQRGYVNGALRCHDLRTGALLWETLLSGFQMEQTMFGEMAREPFAGAILEEDGIVYYLNQGGVVAAVDLLSGRVRWLATYDTIDVVATFSPNPELRDLSWGPNPLLLLGNVLLLTPRDSEHLYAIDTGMGPGGAANGGKILWRYTPSVNGSGQAELRDLLGCHRGLLYFTGPGDIVNGPGEVTALDLTSLDAQGLLPGGGPPRKLPPLRVEGPIPGPGVLTSSGVLLSDDDGLQLVSFDLGEVRPISTGPYRPSEGGSYPGRLQVSGGLVYMTSRHLLSAYAPPAAPQPR